MTAYDRIRRALREGGHLLEDAAESSLTIAGLTEDSRRVEPGWLFCAIAGTVEDGHTYLPEALSRGASAAIVTRRSDLKIPQLVVDNSRVAGAIAAAEWFGRPAADLDVIGVTGTNGKSTTVALIRHLFNVKSDVGSVGTLGAFDGRGTSLYEEGLTTPGAIQLQETLARLRDAGVRRVVMEVSSHALDQDRVEGVALVAGVFTNLTHDHLDYHASFDDYLRAKARLADMVVENGVLVVSADEPRWSELPEKKGVRRVTFGASDEAEVRARDVRLGPHGTSLVVHFREMSLQAQAPLLGEFNVSNALAAAAVAWSLGEDPQEIVSRLAHAPQVPGRMERISSSEFLILSDYAHTPDALERAISAARGLTSGRLIVVFGCGGDRDRGKRAVMGRIAAHGADVALVTSDNPRTEDPERIIDDIEEGMEGHVHMRITDRREAIAQAMAVLNQGDCLLLAGKGHETYQVIGTDRLPFDEREIVRTALADRTNS